MLKIGVGDTQGFEILDGPCAMESRSVAVCSVYGRSGLPKQTTGNSGYMKLTTPDTSFRIAHACQD
jgi:hypothetical protein